MKHKLLIACLLLSSLLLSGCGKKFFVDEAAKYQQVRYTKDTINYETFYVKNGSAFYQTYSPCGNKDLIWFINDLSLVPDYYKGELLAYASAESTGLSSLSSTRFKDLGYSVGVTGIEFRDGYACFTNDNCVEDSRAVKDLAKLNGELKIETINGAKISEDSLTKSGTITGLAKDEEITVGLYNGTSFTEVTLIADVHFMERFESYNLDNAELTKNGYLAVTLPDDLKSGYYSINGTIFRYHDHPRGECTAESDYPNNAYYSSKEEEYAVRYEQFIFSNPTNANEVLISFTYDAGENDDKDVTCLLLAPDGTEYDITCENGNGSLNLEKMTAGRWYLNILPKGAMITEINIDSSTMHRASIEEDTEFIVPDGLSHVAFRAKYIGIGDVWGTIEYEDGSSYILENSENEKDNNGEAYVFVDYPKGGKYTVHLYHYNDTAIDEVYFEETNGSMEEEIIVIE